MSGIDDAFVDLIARSVQRALTRLGVDRPVAHPAGVSIPEAARLISVSDDTIRRLLAEGRIRQLDIPGRRVVVATVSLFELDPGWQPGRHLTAVTGVPEDGAA